MLTVPCETKDKLLEYVSLLKKWNSSINLISEYDLDNVWCRHIVDCLQLMRFIEDKNITIVDLGSGAGLPGIVLSICGIEKIVLIEADERKAMFLYHASTISDFEVVVKNQKIGSDFVFECDILISRSFGKLSTIFDITRRVMVKDKFLLLKGKSYREEIRLASDKWLFEHNLHDSISNIDGKILEIKGDVLCRHK